jgi:putative peptidoglycan lipid II flippase
MGPLLHCGLALATALSSMVNFVLLTYCLRKKIGAIGLKKIIESVSKSMICSIVMGISIWLFIGILPVSENTSLLRLLSIVSSGILVGIIIYGLAAYVLRCRELKHLLTLVRKG